MSKLIFIILITTFFVHGVFSQDAYYLNQIEKDDSGTLIQIILKNDKIISGKLLSVRDTTLLLYSKSPNRNSLTGDVLSDIILIKNSEIKKVVVEGKSKIGSYSLIGAASGIGLGVLIGLSSGDDQSGFFTYSAPQKALIMGGALGIIGLVGGFFAGAISSTGEKEFRPLINQNFDFLKPVAMFQIEPAFLERIK